MKKSIRPVKVKLINNAAEEFEKLNKIVDEEKIKKIKKSRSQ